MDNQEMTNTAVTEYNLIDAFKMLGLPLRWEIIKMVSEAGEVGMTHYEICEQLEKHLGAWPQLKRLSEAGVLIKTTYDSRDVRYTLNTALMRTLVSQLQNIL